MGENDILYQHSEPGRRFSTVAALLVFVGFTAYAFAWSAPWWFLVIPVVGIIGLGWIVFVNPISGCRLDQQAFEYFSGNTRCNLAIADIANLRIIEWSDSPPSASVQMKDGTRHFVNAVCFGGADALRNGFVQAGIVSGRD